MNDVEPILAKQSEQVVNDFNAVCDDHDLNWYERQDLARIVAGAIPGNRDRPLFSLAKWMAKHIAALPPFNDGYQALFELLAGRQCDSDRLISLPTQYDRKKDRSQSTLLSFLTSMDDFSHSRSVANAILSFSHTANSQEAIQEMARSLSRELHSYRRKFFRFEAHRQDFQRIRGFYVAYRPDAPVPIDGDSIELWVREGNRAHWATHSSVLHHLMAYHDSLSFADTQTNIEDARISALPIANHIGSEASANGAERFEPTEDAFFASVEQVTSSALKILKGPQESVLRSLLALGAYPQRWPESCLFEIVFSPVQTTLSGRLRNKVHTAPKSLTENSDPTAKSVTAINTILEIARVVHDCLLLALELAELPTRRQTDPELSMLSVESKMRRNTLRRRSTFSSQPDEELKVMLLELSPALQNVRDCVLRVTRIWRVSPTFQTQEWNERLGDVFQKKLHALYADELNGEAR